MSQPSWPLLRTWWRCYSKHLSDDRLLSYGLGTTTEPTDVAASIHLDDCERCANRFEELTNLLQCVSDIADADFDASFPPARLQLQRARIGRRLTQAVGTVEPARVIRFPFTGRPIRPRHVHQAGWLMAAATGLLLGVTAGQFLHYHPKSVETTASAAVDTNVTRASVNRDQVPRAVAGRAPRTDQLDMTGTVHLSPPDTDRNTETTGLTLTEFEQVMLEEEFLGSLAVALASFQVSELESIETLTPRVQDFAVNLR